MAIERLTLTKPVAWMDRDGQCYAKWRSLREDGKRGPYVLVGGYQDVDGCPLTGDVMVQETLEALGLPEEAEDMPTLGATHDIRMRSREEMIGLLRHTVRELVRLGRAAKGGRLAMLTGLGSLPLDDLRTVPEAASVVLLLIRGAADANIPMQDSARALEPLARAGLI